MKGKILLVLLLFWPGVCPLSFQEVHVKSGEMAVLQCPSYREYSDGDAEVFWTSHTVDEMKLFNMSTSAEQRQMGVLVHGRILVILRASVNHQGNYSCSFRNSSRRSWINLRVYTVESKESGKMIQDSKTCYTDKSCTLYCHDENILFDTWNITRNSTTCHKEGEPSPKDGYFSSVKKEDSGIYTCTWSYLYDGQIYNMTSMVKLDVQPSEITKKAVIISPENSQEFDVDLDSTVVIDCKAVTSSDTDDLFWLSGDSFVETNSTLPVFYNYTWVNSTEEISMTASLVFRQVSEEDLSKNYTCKLQSDYETSFVTITLKQNDSTVVIDCKAVTSSDTDDLFWLSGDSFVETNSTLPVFYNYTWVNSTEEINMTASLVFRQVSEEDLSNNYTCKLQSDYQTSFVTITLKQKAVSHLAMGLCIFLAVLVVLPVAIYTMFNIILWLQKNLGFYHRAPDRETASFEDSLLNRNSRRP
uniref:Uncharacterized LOC101475796 n=1 Tax=Maylandia zebra TaxID=106582 RepID=A0A3P9BDF4_9CICH